MSSKMARRKRQARLKRIRTERVEDRLFYGRGAIPASAARVSVCSCGAKAFSRAGGDRTEDGDFFDDFDSMHTYCDELVSA